MNQSNPYLPPQVSEADHLFATPPSGELPPEIFRIMAQTKPWVTFLSILGFIGTGCMVTGGLAVALLGAFAQLPSQLPGYFGLIYLVLGAFYIFPSLYLYRYGQGIGRLLKSGGVADLTVALHYQKSLWRFVGIFTVVLMVIYGLVIMGAIVFGVVSAMHGVGK